MEYQKEYNEYVAKFTELKKDLTTNSGDVASVRIMEIEGMNFRVGQIIAELEAETADEYIRLKESSTIMTDKQAQVKADLAIRARHGISLTHFINMNKAFQSTIQSFKKRLRQLEWERYQ